MSFTEFGLPRAHYTIPLYSVPAPQIGSNHGQIESYFPQLAIPRVYSWLYYRTEPGAAGSLGPAMDCFSEECIGTEVSALGES